VLAEGEKSTTWRRLKQAWTGRKDQNVGREESYLLFKGAAPRKSGDTDIAGEVGKANSRKEDTFFLKKRTRDKRASYFRDDGEKAARGVLNGGGKGP